MSFQYVGNDRYEEVREGVRALCAEFPAEYHRRIDEARGYPEEFVDALSKAGWMAALIPEDYGGSGLGDLEKGIVHRRVFLSSSAASPWKSPARRLCNPTEKM